MREDCRQRVLRFLSDSTLLHRSVCTRGRVGLTPGTVVLMFDAWTATGDLKYRGTDLMVVRDGLVERIVTINHKSGVVFRCVCAWVRARVSVCNCVRDCVHA